MRAQWVCSRERRIALYKRTSINQSVHRARPHETSRHWKSTPSHLMALFYPPCQNIDSLILPSVSSFIICFVRQLTAKLVPKLYPFTDNVASFQFYIYMCISTALSHVQNFTLTLIAFSGFIYYMKPTFQFTLTRLSSFIDDVCKYCFIKRKNFSLHWLDCPVLMICI